MESLTDFRISPLGLIVFIVSIIHTVLRIIFYITNTSH